MRCKALTSLTSLALLAVATPAWAHFVWVETDVDVDGQPRVVVSFAEGLEGGSANLVDRIAGSEAWLRTPQGEPSRLELTTWIDEPAGVGALVAPVPAEGSAAVDVACRYGVFERGETSMLLNYYAKHLRLNDAGDLAKLARAERLPLDIVPRAEGKGLQLQVLWQGRPAAGVEVVVLDPQDESRQFETNDRGTVTFSPTEAGRYAIRARHVEADRAGELDGKSYSQAWSFCTLTIDLPLAEASDSAAAHSASDLLLQARQNRAVWEDFPGMTADVRMHVDHQAESGRITIAANGDISLQGIDQVATPFVMQQLESLVMHRMPGSQIDDEGAEFEQEDGKHALGRLLVLDDQRMGSVYRVHDDVITEVNRVMGKQRFTISVLDVEHNRDGKYLPHVFTVSFWDVDSGALNSSLTYYHQWQRLGAFDLPSLLTIVRAGKDERTVVRVEFSNLELLDQEVAAK